MSAPNTDAPLTKMTRIRDRVSVQFRAEVFNVSNNFNLYQQQPKSTLTSSPFGTVKIAKGQQQQRQPASFPTLGKV